MCSDKFSLKSALHIGLYRPTGTQGIWMTEISVKEIDSSIVGRGG